MSASWHGGRESEFLGKLYAEIIVALRLVDTWCVFLTDTLVGLCGLLQNQKGYQDFLAEINSLVR